MPIHLDSLSRRRFVQHAAIFATTPLLASRGLAEKEVKSWALLSDTHIAADPTTVSRQGTDMAANLRAVVSEVAAEADSLAGVIVDGDCAYNDGQPGDYETLSELITPLVEAGLPIHFTMGNHDNRDVFRDALESDAPSAPVANKHCGIIETPEVDWILIDTLRFVNKVEGEVGAEQLDWLKKRLQEESAKPAIIVGHHYPQVFRTDVIPSDKPIKITGLVDSETFLAALDHSPAAKAYVFGHSHRWEQKQADSGLHHVNLPPTAYVFDPARPSGWVRATPDFSGMNLTLSSLDKEHPAHGETVRLDWR